MRKMFWVLCTVGYFAVFADTPTITDVTAQQRYPWNGKVDISYTVTGDIVTEAKQKAWMTSLKVVAIDRTANTTNIATQLSGDTNLTAGTHSVVWDMGAEGLSFKSSNVVFKVLCETTNALYCVIDLSAGANASAYPITHLAEPPTGGFNMDEYKLTKLVLRRIEPGSFLMCGQYNEYNVTLTKPFFCGVFEVTQKQYALVMGSNPSAYKGDKMPVEKTPYNTIRGSSNGAKWPASSSVDSSSFMGKLRTRTGLDFDLPTEAQWEYACCAGTTSDYNNGGNSESDLKKLGRYGLSGPKGSTTVGSYMPNTWGLYDMHGNVYEWCLDWYANLSNAVTDPKGSSSGSKRVSRGGCWFSGASRCRSSDRDCNTPSFADSYYSFGFRLFRTMAN